MPPDLNQICDVYWVSDATCLSVETHGYVGITAKRRTREAVHRRRWPGSTFSILFSGTRRECLAHEHRLRPYKFIGWNTHVGGGRLRGLLSRQEPMQTFRVFATLQEARDYRHQHGTGGWIFECEATREATIFPPEMPPTAILHHPLTRGKTGNLIGAA